jgi:hypothetical protein
MHFFIKNELHKKIFTLYKFEHISEKYLDS